MYQWWWWCVRIRSLLLLLLHKYPNCWLVIAVALSRRIVVCQENRTCEYSNMKNIVWFYAHSKLRDLLSKHYQICCADARISGENTYQIWSKSHQPFLKYEPSKSHSFYSFFLHVSSFCTLAKSCHKTQMCIQIASNLAYIKRDNNFKVHLGAKFDFNASKISRIINNFHEKWHQ